MPVPTTAIYSRTDGIVRWHTCIDEVGPEHENVEVRGSHSGLGHNPTVLAVIGDRLAQPKVGGGRSSPRRGRRPVTRALRAGARAPPRRAWRGLRP